MDDVSQARPVAVILFNFLLGALLLAMFLSSFAPSPADAEPSLYEHEWAIIVGANSLLSGIGSLCLFVAAVCLINSNNSRRYWQGAALAQRGGFWCIFLKTVLLFGILWLPSEGGGEGFVIMLALPFYMLATCLALACAVWLTRASRSKPVGSAHRQ